MRPICWKGVGRQAIVYGMMGSLGFVFRGCGWFRLGSAEGSSGGWISVVELWGLISIVEHKILNPNLATLQCSNNCELYSRESQYPVV